MLALPLPIALAVWRTATRSGSVRLLLTTTPLVFLTWLQLKMDM
jgi:hypothetical protein